MGSPKYLKDNTCIITVRDEETASQILNQVPRAAIKQNVSVKRWRPKLSLEEIRIHLVPFWVQMKGIPLNLGTKENVKKLTTEVKEFLELEDVVLSRGFLRVGILVNTTNPLAASCWLARDRDCDSWVEFMYERLQDFCYNCGRIGHAVNERSFETNSSSAAAYEECMRTE